MDLDDHTLHTYRALTECPQGQQPGELFQATEAAGDVLVKVGCAERVDPSEKKPKGYKRRDQVAEAPDGRR